MINKKTTELPKIDPNEFTETIESKGVLNNIKKSAKKVITAVAVVMAASAFAPSVMAGDKMSFTEYKAQQQQQYKAHQEKAELEMAELEAELEMAELKTNNNKSEITSASISGIGYGGTNLKYLDNVSGEQLADMEKSISNDLNKLDSQAYRFLMVLGTIEYANQHGTYPNSSIDAVKALNDKFENLSMNGFNVNSLANKVMTTELLREKTELAELGHTNVSTQEVANMMMPKIDKVFDDLPNYLNRVQGTNYSPSNLKFN